MRIPKKITPDSIVDSIVEVRYLSDMPFEVLVGVFFNAFDESYTYTNRPVKPIPTGTVMSIGNLSLLYNDKITLQLAPNSFIFNCLEKYVGWDTFKPEIEKALITIEKTNRVSSWIRVGLRYITHYTDRDLETCTNFTFGFGLPEIKSSSTTFHSEFSYKKSKVILNLINMLPVVRQVLGQPNQQIVPTSVIDIDMIQELVNVKTVSSLVEAINDSHEKEKEIFFSLLKPNFLDTLNPEY